MSLVARLASLLRPGAGLVGKIFFKMGVVLGLKDFRS